VPIERVNLLIAFLLAGTLAYAAPQIISVSPVTAPVGTQGRSTEAALKLARDPVANVAVRGV
jgi:hypothetical protein